MGNMWSGLQVCFGSLDCRVIRKPTWPRKTITTEDGKVVYSEVNQEIGMSGKNDLAAKV